MACFFIGVKKQNIIIVDKLYLPRICVLSDRKGGRGTLVAIMQQSRCWVVGGAYLKGVPV